MNLKIKNGYINAFVQILDSLQLTIKPNRMRTRMIRMLAKYEVETIMPDKQFILEKFCTKNEKGDPLMRDREKGIYLFEDPDAEEEATEALNELLNEEYIIPLDEYNKDMIITVAKALLEDETIKVSGQLAELLDDWLVMFEEAIAFYEKQDKKKREKKE